jgi:hypothetical protein
MTRDVLRRGRIMTELRHLIFLRALHPIAQSVQRRDYHRQR